MSEYRESVETIVTKHLGESVLALKERYLEGANLSAIQKMSKHAWKITFGFENSTAYTLVGQNNGNDEETIEITATDIEGFPDETARVEISLPAKPSLQSLPVLAQIANNLHVIAESYPGLPGSGEVTLSSITAAE